MTAPAEQALKFQRPLPDGALKVVLNRTIEEHKKPEHWFKPGQSGNPAGKPKGARNKTTLAIEALLTAKQRRYP